jgi:hypothetical protein
MRSVLIFTIALASPVIFMAGKDGVCGLMANGQSSNDQSIGDISIAVAILAGCDCYLKIFT